MDLVVINHEDFGLEEQKAKQISDMFKPMLDEMAELEVEFNKLMRGKPSEAKSKKARELRLRYVKVRTGTDKIHKQLKSFYVQGGKFVDGWKNAQRMASEGNEERLKGLEDHYVNIEKERVEKLRLEREAQLEKLEAVVIPENLGGLEEDVWQNYLEGVKTTYDRLQVEKEEKEKKRLADEKKARDKQLKDERISKLNDDRITECSPYASFIENFGTIKFGELTEKKYKTILSKATQDHASKAKEDKRIREENEALQQQNEAREKKDKQNKERQKKVISLGLIWDGEKFSYKDINFYGTEIVTMSDKKFQEALKGATKRMDVIIKEEEKLAAKEKKEKEDGKLAKQKLIDIQAEKEKNIQAELNADDATKVESLIKNLEYLTTKYTFKSEKNVNMYTDVRALLAKVINHIKK